MSYYKIPLKAGIAFRLDVPGALILIDSTGAAAGVDVALVKNGTPGVTMPARKTAFRYTDSYEGVILTTAVDATVGIFLTYSDVQLGWADGAAVSVPGGVVVNNTALNPVPVDILTPITLTATAVEVNNTDAQSIPVVQKIGASFTTEQKAGAIFTTEEKQLSTIVNIAPVTVGTVESVLVSDATLKRLRIRNSHATAIVGIGATGVTLANAAIQLQPGDIWNEEDAAGADWYVISDTAATDVQMQGLK